MSQSEVSKYVAELDKFMDAKDNYMNDIFIDYKETTQTSTTTDMVDELEAKNSKTKSENVGNIKSTNFSKSSGGGGGTSFGNSGPRTVTKADNTSETKTEKTSTKKESDYEDINYDEILGQDGETLFTQEQIEKQNKKLKEDYSFLGKA